MATDTTRKVRIEINGHEVFLGAGRHSVAELKRFGGVPATDELVQVKGGQIVVLQDDGFVVLEGGERFLSSVRSCPSS